MINNEQVLYIRDEIKDIKSVDFNKLREYKNTLQQAKNDAVAAFKKLHGYSLVCTMLNKIDAEIQNR